MFTLQTGLFCSLSASHSAWLICALRFSCSTFNMLMTTTMRVWQGDLIGGAQVEQIERSLWNIWDSSAGLLPTQPPVFLHPPDLCSLASHQALRLPSPPLSSPPHTHFILSSLRVEPAQSCQSASLCQPNYHARLKVENHPGCCQVWHSPCECNAVSCQVCHHRVWVKETVLQYAHGTVPWGSVAFYYWHPTFVVNNSNQVCVCRIPPVGVGDN